MDRVADKIGAEIDGIEERILAGEIKSEMRSALGRSRRTSVRLHRQLAGLRTLFHRLEQKNSDHLSPALRLQAGKLAQRLDGLDHDIVELRERSRLLEEEIRFKMEEESNRHLHTLSIVTTLLLPPTLVTGIFGMNTKGLPLTDVETGFLWAAALMIGAAGLAYLIMRRRASSDSAGWSGGGTTQMSSLRSWVVIAAAYLASLAASTGALAGAKDESAAEWLAPKWLNEWHDGLADKGLNFGATYIADNIGNVSGGVARGAIHLGRLDLSVDADLEKLFGWTGGRFYANAFEIYGRGLTRNYILNLATISEIEALPDTRLYNAYFEQSFFNNALNIRVGQQAADVEFFDSETDDLFINGTFGWPAIKATNLPAGGPAPPIAVPGIRVKAALSDKITAFGAVFNGNAARPGDGDPQTARQSRSGVSRQRSAVGHRAGSLRL